MSDGRQGGIFFCCFDFILYFCRRFRFPREGAKRESGENPEQSRCCEFQLVSTAFKTSHCGASRCCGKAKKLLRNESEDLPRPSIINSPRGIGLMIV